MIIIDLKGKEHNWKPRSGDFLDSHKSALHLKIRKFLKECFPFDIIMEEVSLPGSSRFSKKDLMADFYLPNRSLVIEAHGEQHYSYNSFFFKNKLEFSKAQRRDLEKKEWCESNGLRIIELKFSDTTEQWRYQIESR